MNHRFSAAARAILELAYAASGQPENFQVHHFDGGHVWNTSEVLQVVGIAALSRRAEQGSLPGRL